METRRRPATRAEDCPTAWFCVLERARIDGDRARERKARRELARLGVKVAWPVQAESNEGGATMNAKATRQRPGRPKGAASTTAGGLGSIRADELLPLRELCRRLGKGAKENPGD